MNIIDVNITDLEGNEYDINDWNVEGNDCINITIKKREGEYVKIRGRDECKHNYGHRCDIEHEHCPFEFDAHKCTFFDEVNMNES